MTNSSTATVRIQSPSRLHFGLLAFGDRPPRGFGGAGLMIQEPGIVIEACRAETNVVHLPQNPSLQQRAENVLRSVVSALEIPFAVELRFNQTPAEHVGLGTGTQLCLSIAKAVAMLAGREEPIERLAAWTGRGKRSAIGIHGFQQGGLLVDGGKTTSERLAPILHRQRFPDWPIVLIRPERGTGTHGDQEQQAITCHPTIDTAVYDRLARLLLDLLGAVADVAYEDFGEALYAYNRLAGECFRFAQGGIYAHPLLERLVENVRSCQVPAVGQSSWGPTLFAICPDNARANELVETLSRQNLDIPLEILVTRACNQGAAVTVNTD